MEGSSAITSERHSSSANVVKLYIVKWHCAAAGPACACSGASMGCRHSQKCFYSSEWDQSFNHTVLEKKGLCKVRKFHLVKRKETEHLRSQLFFKSK